MNNLRIFLAIFVGMAVAACGGSDDAVGGGVEGPEGSLGDEAVREQCAEAGLQMRAVDVNGDQQPDIRHVYEGERIRCSEYDMNYDGQVDVVRFFGPDGRTPVREEHDFDFDGRLDQISYFEAGELVRKELDTNFDNVIDTWMWCEQGLVKRAQRDRRNTGEPDTWEDYENGLLTLASYDENNDGEPEKWEVFTNGRLTEVRYDTDSDGRPDRREEIGASEAGPPDEPIACDDRDLERQEQQAGTRTDGTTESPEGGDEGTDGSDEAGEDDADAGDAPWDDGAEGEAADDAGEDAAADDEGADQ